MTTSNPLLQVTDLKRNFGSVRAVDGVTFSVNAGQVVGLIGANGAGKTTLMRMLATLDMPDEGRIVIGGIDAVSHPRDIRPLIGWMPDDFRPYKNTDVREYLDFFARAYGLPPDRIMPRVDEVIDFTELNELRHRLIDKLSKGQTQRLCLARTLISNPSLMILDEPAAGLDPKARLEFKNLVRILKQQGKTILISSHILSELGEMCDSLVFMDAGKIVHEGDKEILLNENRESGSDYEIKIAGDTKPLELWLSIQPNWTLAETRNDGVIAHCTTTEPIELAEELKRLCGEFPIYGFHRCERKLEDAFVDILRKQKHGGSSPTARPAETTPTTTES